MITTRNNVLISLCILLAIILCGLPSFSFAQTNIGVGSGGSNTIGTGSGGSSNIGTGNSSSTNIGVGSSQCGQALCNPLQVASINDLLTLVLKAAVNIGSIILTLAIIWTGFKFVAARGNEEKIRSARTALMWTIIGGLILLGATGIQAVLTSTISSITS